MKCKIVFDVNGVPVEIEHDFASVDTPLTDSDIMQALEDNPDKVKRLTELLYNNALNHRDIKNVSIKELKTKKGLTSNCTVDFITQQPEYSTITFLDTSAKILLLDHLSIGNNKNIRGRIINSQGEEIFVIRNNKNDVLKLANFLNTRKHFLEIGLLISPDSLYKRLMNSIIKERNKLADPIPKGDYAQLLLDYLYNQKKYYGIFIGKRSAAAILSDIYTTVKDWDLPISYNTPFIDDLSRNLVSLASFALNNNVIKKGDYFISFDFIYKLLKHDYPNVCKKLGITSLLKFKDFLQSDINSVRTKLESFQNLSKDELKLKDLKLFNKLPIEETTGATLFHQIFRQEPEFTYEFVRISDKGIIFHHDYETIESRYGVGYDTIASMDIINDNYRGYKIYKQHNKGKDRYYISRGSLEKDSTDKVFTSELDAIRYIDHSLRLLNLELNSLIEFKRLESTVDTNGVRQYINSINVNSIKSGIHFNQGQIIEVLDVPISRDTRVTNEEAAVLNGRLSDFQKLIEQWPIEESLKLKIIESMNTPEKAVTFLYKVNERLGNDRTNNEEIDKILNEINTADFKYYYVDLVTYINKLYSYRVIPTPADQVDNYRKEDGKNIPTVLWMNAVKEVLEKKFNGIKINLLPAALIKELDIAKNQLIDPNTSKAFIYNGLVYVNTTIAKSTDLLHEYVHIILGCLKTNPDLISNYESLLHYVVSTTEGERKLEDLRLRYDNISEMDLREEVFAEMFSNYVRGMINPQTNTIFKVSEDQIKKITESIFDTKIGSIKEFYGKKVISVFTKFYKEVAKLLLENDIDYSQIELGRKYSNYISQLINKGDITEEC